MNPLSKGYNDCNTRKKERKNNLAIIKDSDPQVIVINGEIASGTTFTVSSITLNSSCLSSPIIKIDFISKIFTIDFDRTVAFQVFKLCNNQSQPIPVGPVWNFLKTGSAITTYSFFVCDNEPYNNQWCTYTVMATIK